MKTQKALQIIIHASEEL